MWPTEMWDDERSLVAYDFGLASKNLAPCLVIFATNPADAFSLRSQD